MDKNLTEKILEETNSSYNGMADKFSNTRSWQWPIMEKLGEKYIKAGQRVLDVGCGNGRLYKKLASQQVNYLGVDNSEKLITKAKETGGDFQVKDILKIEFNQEFDVVFALAVLNHLPSQELRTQALKNIYQALKPGGRLIMTNWNLWKLSKKHKTVWKYKIFRRLEGRKVGRLGFKDVITVFQDGESKYPLYYRAFTLRELKGLVKKTGFEVVEGYYEKNGTKSHWWGGNNLVLVGYKRM